MYAFFIGVESTFSNSRCCLTGQCEVKSLELETENEWQWLLRTKQSSRCWILFQNGLNSRYERLFGLLLSEMTVDSHIKHEVNFLLLSKKAKRWWSSLLTVLLLIFMHLLLTVSQL